MTTVVGREAELDAVRRAAATAGTGAPPLVALVGEAGIGKTALAEVLAQEAREAGRQVWWTRSAADATAPPFWLWRQVVPDLPPEVERFALFEALRTALLAEGPTLLVVDDAQWADESSLQALRHVLRHSREANLIVLLTLRHADAAQGWRSVGPDLLQEAGAQQVPLRGLDHTATAAVLREVSGADVSDVVAAEAVALTGGNPFYLREVGRGWRADQPLTLPRSLVDLVDRRVRALAATTQELLAAASVLGDEVDLAVAARLVDRPTAACLRDVDEALTAGVLVRAHDGVRFSHALLRSALEQRLTLQRAVDLHQRAARAIEALHAGDPRAVHADLARHWCATAVLGAVEPGVTWARTAAETAAGALAWEESARLFTLALTTGGTRLDVATRVDLLLGLVRVHVACGQLTQAHTACREATDLAVQQGDPDLLARCALALDAIGVRTWDRDLSDACRRALDHPRLTAPSTRARLLARLTEALIYSGEGSEAQGASERALALARSVADEDAEVACLRARQLALSGPDNTEERVALAARMMELGQRRARPDEEMWGLLWRIDAHWETGQLAEIAADTARLAWCVEHVGTTLARWHLLVTRAGLAQARGDFAGALEDGRAAFALLSKHGHPAAFGAFMSLLSTTGRHVGHDPMALSPPDHAAQAQEVRGEIFAYIGPALTLAEVGRLDEAEALFVRPGPPSTWAVPPYFELVAYSCATLAAALLGRTDDLRWLRGRLSDYRGRMAVGGAGVASCLGPVDLVLGTAAAALGDLETAEAELSRAAALARERGLAGCAVECDVRLAELLARTGRGAAAKQRARTAQAEAKRLGMTPWVDRAAKLLDDGGLLTPREREVADLLGQGRSNRDIATALVLSERTAENHVQSVLRKLGLTSRAQVAATWAQMSTETSTSPDVAGSGRS